MTRGVGVPALVLGAILASGCKGTRAYLPSSSPYDRLPEGQEEALREARVLSDSGRYESAHALLQPLLREAPRNLRLGTFQQDLELGTLAEGGTVRGIEGGAPELDAERLFGSYRRRADEVPTSEAYVLAARLAPDSERAMGLLERALELDRENPWAHYGMAWAHAREGRYDDARKALERSFAIDPGHLPSVRLDGALLARAGDAKRAISALETWMARSFEDPTVDPRQRATVRLDLAILLVSERRAEEALGLLEAVESGAPQRDARVELVRAAAYQSLGDLEDARRAVRFAREASPDELYALVHEALLAAQRGDTDAERAAWKEALALAEGEGGSGEPGQPQPADFRSLLVRLQALTRLARLGEPVP